MSRCGCTLCVCHARHALLGPAHLQTSMELLQAASLIVAPVGVPFFTCPLKQAKFGVIGNCSKVSIRPMLHCSFATLSAEPTTMVSYIVIQSDICPSYSTCLVSQHFMLMWQCIPCHWWLCLPLGVEKKCFDSACLHAGHSQHALL